MYAPSPTASGQASRESPTPFPDTGSPPPLNVLEAKIVKALASLGIEGNRAEHSFAGASIWAQFDGDRALFINAHPTGTDHSDVAVLSERLIGSVTVQRVEHTSGLIRDRFQCGDTMYETDGAVPPGFADFEQFLARLTHGLGC